MSVGEDVRSLSAAVCFVRGPQLDHKAVWQAGDGNSCIPDEALLDAELVGAVGREDADAAGTDLDFIDASVFSFYSKGTAFSASVQGNAHDQDAVLVQIGGIAAFLFRGKHQPEDAAQAQQKQECRNAGSVFFVGCIFCQFYAFLFGLSVSSVRRGRINIYSIAEVGGKMKKFFCLILGMILILDCTGCGQESGPWQSADTAMGTLVQQTVYSREDAGKAFLEESTALLVELEENLLSWRLETSELYRLNASGGREEGFRPSEELADILIQCMELYERSEGAFDVAVGPAARLWNIDQWAAAGGEESYQPPDPAAVAEALELCGSGRIRFGEKEQTVVYLEEGMQIDLGAVGKGVALSRLEKLLEEHSEIEGAVISVGGSVLTYGSRPEGGSWRVGIVNPLDTSSYVGVLVLEGRWCVSTSGDYERYVESEGVRYHHILDPATGYPADSGVRGVTVLSKDGLLGDGLSTACFILGAEEGTALAAAWGAEVLFVLEDGEIRMSEGMKEYFSPVQQ